jgi:hypothetical protein
LAGLDYLMTTTAVREDDEIKAVLLKEVHASATAE